MPNIDRIVMGKYHTLIVANHNKLYTHGFGSGGRLGLNHEDTQFTPQIVAGIHGKIVDVAAGHDHSLAVTADGKVFTWGSNEHGQLGYACDTLSHERPCQLMPREVGGALRKTRVVAAAASKYHCAVFSDNGSIYTWGKDNGQLGKLYLFSQNRVVQRHTNHEKH